MKNLASDAPGSKTDLKEDAKLARKDDVKSMKKLNDTVASKLLIKGEKFDGVKDG